MCRFVVWALLISFFSCEKKEVKVETSYPSVTNSIRYEFYTQGRKRNGSIVLLAPFLPLEAYLEEETLYSILHQYFKMALAKDVILPGKTIVALPKNVADFWWCLGETKGLIGSRNQSELLQITRSSHLGEFFYYLLIHKKYSSDWQWETLFQIKQRTIAESYQTVFSKLAQEFQVIILAPVLFLQSPTVREGRITVGEGPWESKPFLFKATGEIVEKDWDPIPLLKRNKIHFEFGDPKPNPCFSQPSTHSKANPKQEKPKGWEPLPKVHIEVTSSSGFQVGTCETRASARWRVQGANLLLVDAKPKHGIISAYLY